jgi:hypothetical protein
MLNEKDLEFIRETRKEITHLRTVPVILFSETISETIDPLTGEPIRGTSEQVAECTWSNLTSGGPGSDDIIMVAGVVAEAGDAIADFDISYNMEGVTRVQHEGKMWVVRSKDPVGLGVPNRTYVLLRRVS